MRSVKKFLFLVLCCTPICSLAGNYEMLAEMSTTDFQLIENFIVVKARINQKEGNFIVDTGAEDLTLNERTFGSVALPSMKNSMIDIGTVKHDLMDYKVKYFKWASLERRNFIALVLDLSQMEKVLGLPIMGLIGYHVFRGVELQVDFSLQQLKLLKIDKKGFPLLAQQEDSSPDYNFAFKQIKYLPVLEVQLGAQKLSVGIDSGAAVNLLEQKFKKKVYEESVQMRKVRIAGVFSEPRLVNFHTFPFLNVEDRLAIRFWQTAFSDLSHLRENGLFIDGIIGLASFRSGKLTLNYKQKQLKFWLLHNTGNDKLVPPQQNELTEE